MLTFAVDGHKHKAWFVSIYWEVGGAVLVRFCVENKVFSLCRPVDFMSFYDFSDRFSVGILVMSDANLNLIISLTLMIIAIISVWKDVYNGSVGVNFFRRFTRVGRMLILTAAVFIFVNYFKDYNTEQKVKQAGAEKAKSDSIAEASRNKLDASEEELKASQKLLYQLQLSTKNEILNGVDSSYRRSLIASNDALAKYHIKIIDSLHTVVGTLKLNAINPQLSLAVPFDHPPVFLSGSDTLKIQFASSAGTSYHIRVKAYYILQTVQGDILLANEPYANGQLFITEGVTRTIKGPFRKKLLTYSEILVILNGSFSKDPYEKEIVPYLEAFKYNFRDDKFLGKFEVDFNRFKALIGAR